MSADKDAVLARLQAANAELEAEAQMKRDAERYRWLRDKADFDQFMFLANIPVKTWDERIDIFAAKEQ